MPFPTEFPASAAAKFGQAIISKSFGKDLFEPAYDLQGYAEFMVLGAAPKSDGYASSAEPEYTEEQVAEMLLAAADAHSFAGGRTGLGADREGILALLPWKAIAKIAANILLGLLLAAQPAPDNPANA